MIVRCSWLCLLAPVRVHTFTPFPSSIARTMSSESEGLADIGSTSQFHPTNTSTTASSSSSSSISSWRQLLEISSNRTRKIRGSNYVQIATVEDGLPRCRTVVFRGFLKGVPAHHPLADSLCDGLPCVMKMITDARSNKVPQITKHPESAAEMVWWFPKTSEQYRIRGSILLVGPNDNDDDDNKDTFLQTSRKEQWGNLSDSAREQFYDTLYPGEPWTDNQTTEPIPPGGRDGTTGQVLQPPPENFLLMLLQPHYCDYLKLGAEQYRQIDTLQLAGDSVNCWTSARVNP